MVFVPVSAEIEPRLAQPLVVSAVTQKLHGNAALIGEQQHIAKSRDLAIQLLDAGPRHIEKLVGAFLMFPQGLMGNDTGRAGPRRIQAVLFDTAFPGSGDHGVARGHGGTIAAVRVSQNVVDVAALLRMQAAHARASALDCCSVFCLGFSLAPWP